MGGLDNSEQQYSLRWNDFHSSILSSFRHLRDEEDFVDVTLACDGCSFTAHKVVLSACSPYFRSLLKANPCQHPIVILRDVREQDMEALLRFMYNGEVHIGQEQLTDFLKTAQTLQVRGLADVPTKDHQKLLPNTNSLPWPPSNETQVLTNDNPLSPPPPKRSRSSEQHHNPLTPITPLPPSMNRFSPSPASVNSLHNNNNNSSPLANNHTPCELSNRESLLSQALETSQSHMNNNITNQLKGSDSSVHAHSTGEESNSSDTGLSERGGLGGGGPPPLPPGLDLIHPKSEPQDYSEHPPTPHHNNSLVLDPSRTPNFPAALLGLQGTTGLLPGPSGMHNNGQDNSFGARLPAPSSDRPVCPYCSRQYSSTSNLRQHVLNVHLPTTQDQWHICSVCGKKCKTKHYLINHQLQAHGIRQPRRGLDMMRVRATDPRPCPKCGKIYRSAHTLRTHLEDKHTVCPGYRCVLCGTVAKSRNSLHSHMSRQHRGISTKDLPVLPMPSPFDPELASRLLAKAGVKVSAAELRARSSPTGPPRRSDARLDLKSSGSSVCGGDDPEDLTIHNNTYPGTPLGRYGSVDVRPLSPPRAPLPPHPLKDPRGPSTGSAILDTYLQMIAENSQFQLSAEQAAKMAARMNEEQRRLGLDVGLGMGNHRIMDRHDDSSGGEEDEYSEDDEPEPPAIKAE